MSDAQQPPEPKIDFSDLDKGQAAGYGNKSGMTIESRPRFGGTVEPGQQIKIRVDDRTFNGQVYGRPDELSAWYHMPDEALAPGEHEIEIWTEQKSPTGEVIKGKPTNYQFEVVQDWNMRNYQKRRDDALTNDPQPEGQDPTLPDAPYQGDTRLRAPLSKWAREQQEKLRRGSRHVTPPADILNEDTDYMGAFWKDETGALRREPAPDSTRVQENEAGQRYRQKKAEELGIQRSEEAQKEMEPERLAQEAAAAEAKAAAERAEQEAGEQYMEDFKQEELEAADQILESMGHAASDALVKDVGEPLKPTALDYLKPENLGTPPSPVSAPGSSSAEIPTGGAGGGATIETGGLGVPAPVVGGAAGPQHAIGGGGQPGGGGGGGGGQGPGGGEGGEAGEGDGDGAGDGQGERTPTGQEHATPPAPISAQPVGFEKGNSGGGTYGVIGV